MLAERRTPADRRCTETAGARSDDRAPQDDRARAASTRCPRAGRRRRPPGRRAPSRAPSAPSHARVRQLAAATTSRAGMPARRTSSAASSAIRRARRPAGVGADETGTPASCRSRTRVVAVGVQRAHARGERRGTAPGRRGVSNWPTCSSVAVTRDAGCATIASIWSADSPVACSRQSIPASMQVERLLAEGVGGDPGARRRAPRRRRPARPPATSGVRSPRRRASIQSATSLTQPSPRAASWRDVRRQLDGLDLVAVVAQVALRRGRGAGRRGSAAAGRRARGPSAVSAGDPRRGEQRARVAVGEGLLLGGVLVGRRRPRQADVAVHVDQARDDPALGDELGARRPSRR